MTANFPFPLQSFLLLGPHSESFYIAYRFSADLIKWYNTSRSTSGFVRGTCSLPYNTMPIPNPNSVHSTWFQPRQKFEGVYVLFNIIPAYLTQQCHSIWFQGPLQYCRTDNLSTETTIIWLLIFGIYISHNMIDAFNYQLHCKHIVRSICILIDNYILYCHLTISIRSER